MSIFMKLICLFLIFQIYEFSKYIRVNNLRFFPICVNVNMTLRQRFTLTSLFEHFWKFVMSDEHSINENIFKKNLQY